MGFEAVVFTGLMPFLCPKQQCQLSGILAKNEKT